MTGEPGMSDEPGMSGVPAASVVDEAQRLIPALELVGVPARLIGGLGVAAHDHAAAVPAVLQREYADIDIVIPPKTNRTGSAQLVELGYTPNARFNALHGSRRLLFYDTANSRQLDIFVGEFAMCHRLDLSRRLNLHPTALAASDLLLTKLQIVELNHKDVLDACRLLLNHEVADVDDPAYHPASTGGGLSADQLSVRRIVVVTSADWGWYTTLSDNLTKVAAASPQLLPPDHSDTVMARVEALLRAMTAAPKGLRWRARSALGRRAAWYELPEEVAPTGGQAGGTSSA